MKEKEEDEENNQKICPEQTHKQTNRDFKYRGYSYPLWIAGGSGPIDFRLFSEGDL